MADASRYDTQQLRAIESFCMQMGLALHRFGAPAYRIEEVLGQIAQRFEIFASFLSTPTSITAAFGQKEQQRVYLTRADPGEINLGKSSRIEALAHALVEERVTLIQAATELDAIVEAPSDYGALVTTFAYALASGAVARLFGGNWTSMLVATGIGWVIGLMAVCAGRWPRFARLFEMSAAGVSALLAAWAAEILGPYSMHVAMLAGLIVLVPGMTLTTAVTELATNNLVAGTARFMGAIVTFLKLGFGAAMGAHLGRLWFHPAADVPVVAAYWVDWPGLIVAAISLSVILQAEWRDMLPIVLVSCAGLVGLHVGSQTLSVELSPFIAALAATLGSHIFARYTHKNPSITQVPAILLLVPGSVGFHSVSALLERNILSGMQTAFNVAITSVGLVAGTLVAGLILPPMKPKKRRDRLANLLRIPSKL